MVATEPKQAFADRTKWTPTAAPAAHPERGLSAKVRLEIVDNWHKEWPRVLAKIQDNELTDTLMLDHDGWLSARQTVLVAFANDEVVGHLSFHVAPVKGADGPLRAGRPALEARLDALAVDRQAVEAGVDQLLIRNAEAHALMLQCQTFRHEPNGCH